MTTPTNEAYKTAQELSALFKELFPADNLPGSEYYFLREFHTFWDNTFQYI